MAPWAITEGHFLVVRFSWLRRLPLRSSHKAHNMNKVDQVPSLLEDCKVEQAP